jgi:hypothetical protein
MECPQVQAFFFFFFCQNAQWVLSLAGTYTKNPGRGFYDLKFLDTDKRIFVTLI